MYNFFFFFALESHRILLLGPQVSASVLFSFFCFPFWSCRGVFRKRHGISEIKMKDDLKFSATATNKYPGKYRHYRLFKFLVETSIKLGDSALYVLFSREFQKKTTNYSFSLHIGYKCKSHLILSNYSKSREQTLQFAFMLSQYQLQT